MRVLVTGADGFVGRHLVQQLEEAGHVPLPVAGPGAHAQHAPAVDLRDLARLTELIRQLQPDGVIHLAGFSSVGKSLSAPSEAFAVNALGTMHVLEAAAHLSSNVRVVLVTSGEIYGRVEGEERALEERPLKPESPYAASKACAEIAGFEFARAGRLTVISARAFNHLGPGQSPGFAVPAFARQIVAIKKGSAPPVIDVGNLDVVRDFLHVADVVVAYRLLLERGVNGNAYNVCSGEGRTVRSLLVELLQLAGTRADIHQNPDRVRANEPPRIVGSPAKLAALGWAPRKTVSDALSAVLAEAST